MDNGVLQTFQELETTRQMLESLEKAQKKSLMDKLSQPSKPMSTFKKKLIRWGLPISIATTYAYNAIPQEDYMGYGLVITLLGAAVWILLSGKEKRPAVDVTIEAINSLTTFRVRYIANPETLIDIEVAHIKMIDGVTQDQLIEFKAMQELQKMLSKGQPEVTRGDHKDGKYYSALEIRSNSPLKSGNYSHKNIARWLVREGLRYPDENQDPKSDLYTALKTAKAKGNGYWGKQ